MFLNLVRVTVVDKDRVDFSDVNSSCGKGDPIEGDVEEVVTFSRVLADGILLRVGGVEVVVASEASAVKDGSWGLSHRGRASKFC